MTGGQCVGISGPSGSGKTRLLRAIADLDVHEGQVALDGVARERFRPSDWRRRVGLLPADNHWWLERVVDHVREVDEEALERLGLEQDLLVQPVARLSSGERQRFALLRLLANRPTVLLLDEPTANLDAHSAARVEELLARYQKDAGAGVLWVSHDLEQIRRVASRRFRMEHGQLREAKE